MVKYRRNVLILAQVRRKYFTGIKKKISDFILNVGNRLVYIRKVGKLLSLPAETGGNIFPMKPKKDTGESS